MVMNEVYDSYQLIDDNKIHLTDKNFTGKYVIYSIGDKYCTDIRNLSYFVDQYNNTNTPKIDVSNIKIETEDIKFTSSNFSIISHAIRKTHYLYGKKISILRVAVNGIDFGLYEIISEV